MVVAFLLFALGSSRTPPATVTVDAIELNTCYDVDKDCYQQVILWEWLPYLNRLGVVSWTMRENVTSIERRGEWHYLTIARRDRIRIVRSKSLRETRTHASQDPERLDRYVWPENLRRGIE